MRPDADYYSFLVKNIPVLMLHTGLHEDYHRPSDVASKINAAGMKRIDRLLLALVCDLANRDARPIFRPACRGEKQEPPAQPAPLVVSPTDKPLRLGLTWQQDESEPGVAIVTAVAAGSPAALAGLLAGDRIYQLSGRDFSSDAEFAELARTLPGPIKLRVERSGKLRTLELRVDAVPLRRAA
jgi:predicted metalloprotease with PDZ domain